jgi:hypothetical protein
MDLPPVSQDDQGEVGGVFGVMILALKMVV